MKKTYLHISYLSIAILGFANTPIYAQTPQPVAMQKVGSQQYIGQSQQIVPTRQTAPVINSIYATPMQHVNDIPLYGRNKSMYFYNQQKQQDGLFADGGLYVFGSFSTGKTTKGVNAENPSNAFFNGVGSTAHSDMGDPTGIGFGFGRTMSSDLNLEIMYNKYTGLKYGNYVQNNYTYENEDDLECTDDDGNNICEPITEKLDDYEVISGGKISSDFFGIGFQYKLNHMFGSLLGGMLKPYIGVQIGFAMNNIEDYTISDPDGSIDTPMDVEGDNGDIEPNPDCAGTTENDVCTQIEYYDGEITYIGKNNRTFGYGLEAGFTLALENNMELDFFYKRTMLGKVQTSGTVLTSYTAVVTDFYTNPNAGSTTDCASGYEISADREWCMAEVDKYTLDSEIKRNTESGNININEFGVKIKYMF